MPIKRGSVQASVGTELRATDPVSGIPDGLTSSFAMLRVARYARSVPKKMGNHLDGIGRETGRARPAVVRQNSQVKRPSFDAGEGNAWHNPGTFLAQIWHKRF
jgi:hypothetical protein